MAGQIITHENQSTRVFGIIQDLSENKENELVQNNYLKEYKRHSAATSVTNYIICTNI